MSLISRTIHIIMGANILIMMKIRYPKNLPIKFRKIIKESKQNKKRNKQEKKSKRNLTKIKKKKLNYL